MAKVLILGGNGFIGKNLSVLLKQRGDNVRSFDLCMPSLPEDGMEYVSGDFFDEDILQNITKDIDVVFHAISSINPGNSNLKYMQGYQQDFIQTIKLCNIVRDKRIKMIFLSSGGTVYGGQELQPINETACPRPINHYGNLKLCIENTMCTFNKQYETDIKIARIANPYGKGQDFKQGVGFIDAVLKKGICGEVVEIYGKGNVIRDYIHIDDVCQMLHALMHYKGKNYIFNLATGKGSSQNQILEIVKEWIPDLKVTYQKSRMVDVEEIVLDNTKILQIYNMECKELQGGMLDYFYYLKNSWKG